MKTVFSHRRIFLSLSIVLGIWMFFVASNIATALNIVEYKDLLTDSGPSEPSNHTISFTLNTDLSPGGMIQIIPPQGFTVLGSSTFAERNVELLVDGVVRTAEAVAAPGVDMVQITPGSPGLIEYTLAPDYTISSGSELQLRIGNHASTALLPAQTYSSTTGTTTTPGDQEPILNSSTLGKHDVQVKVYDGGLVASANPVIFLVNKVTMPNIDTTEEIPPYRFNPTPTSTVGGTTLNVEITLETDEFAFCRYATVPDVDFGSMTDLFSNTGLIFHSTVVPVTPGSVASFYVRCIDDEGNFNIDDFLIQFSVNDSPTGESNTDGDVDGDGTGTGNDGSGSGSGGGGTTGASDGEQPTEGGTSGGGGSGGGGGGGSGGGSGSGSGGGFESTNAPYRSGDGQVIISGYAFPNSTVSFLIDGEAFDTARSNSLGAYSVTLSEIARGVYTFGVYAAGGDGVKSSTYSTSFTVTGARTTALSNINVSPSITTKPNPVNPGEKLVLSGYALPNSTVSIQNSKNNTTSNQNLTTTSDASGKWSYEIDTSGFSKGTYQVRAKSEQEGGRSTNFSNYTFYGVGQGADVPKSADLNKDTKVNLTDFSILLFWWNTAGGNSNPSADINQDGKVSLTDFSILLFNWTG
jgi:hypothetical protein